MNENKKVNSSIVFKLNSWHISRLFFQFLWINTLIVVLFTGALFYHAESFISETAKTINPYETFVQTAPKAVMAPGFLRGFFPENTKNAVRRIVTDENKERFFEAVSGKRYVMWIPFENGFFTAEYPIGRTLALFIRLILVLLLFEGLSIITGAFKGARAMKKALKPIEALTETALRIQNAAKNANPTAQLRDLMGTIDTINATQLDKRVSTDTVQDELKDLAGAINGMLDRINEAYRSQVRFVSDASHELRTPIAVIQGYANLLDRWGKNDEKALQESIGAIKSEAGSMKDLVEQLLFLARGDNDSMQLSMEEFNLSELVSEVVRETGMIDPSHTLTSQIAENIFITADIQLIKQAVRIVVDNSMKYSPAGEAIIVNLSRVGEKANITVQDNGIGIPAEDLPYVFDRFFRSDDSRTRKSGGTGLGLSIAKWIIDRHGGTVEILSRKDLGTRITISLGCSRPLP